MCCNCRKMHGCEAEMAHKLFLIHLLSEVYLPVTSNKPFDDGHPTLTYCLSSFHYFCSDPCILCNWQPFVGIWHTFTVVKFAFVYSSSIAQLLLQLLASVWSIRDLEKTNRFLLIYRGGIKDRWKTYTAKKADSKARASLAVELVWKIASAVFPSDQALLHLCCFGRHVKHRVTHVGSRYGLHTNQGCGEKGQGLQKW
jgi:hypothetical protein